jgi:ADP-ribosylglycohydrolase
VINCGGDTDTNASIAGQIMGTILGYKKLPKNLITQLEKTNKYYKIENVLD